jgi:peptidoglycan/xylan/chitin deacetylase (PgdA/CDA1 family)
MPERAEKLREVVKAHQGDFLCFTVDDIYADNVTPLLCAIVEELGLTRDVLAVLRETIRYAEATTTIASPLSHVASDAIATLLEAAGVEPDAD